MIYYDRGQLELLEHRSTRPEVPSTKPKSRRKPNKIKCRCCKKAKPRSQYYKDSKHKNGIKSSCKTCYSANISKKAKRLRATQARTEQGWMNICRAAKHRANQTSTRRRRKGRDRAGIVDIDVTFLRELLEEQGLDCAVSHRPLSTRPGHNQASLDRIDPKLGYIKGNVRFVRKCVNVARSTMTDAEFISMCRDVVLAARPLLYAADEEYYPATLCHIAKSKRRS